MPIYLGNKKISYQQHIDYNKGSGDTPIASEKKAVNFYDYEGTLLYSYTRDEALGLSELPSLPDRTSEGLTCQGWNYTLENIKNDLTANTSEDRWIDVGAMYIPTDGATHINITFADKYRNVMPLMFTGNVTIDWGDGNTQTVNYTTTITIIHKYAIAQSYPAKYTIKLTVNSGTLTFGGGLPGYNICGSTINNASNPASVPASVYSSRIDSVFIGNGVTSISDYAFYQCYSFTSITIPNSVTSIVNSAFRSCYSLASITIPNSVTSIGTYVFQNCNSLASITIPDSVTSIGAYAFSSCYSLASITIPNSVTSIGDSSFSECSSLASIAIPNGVTSVNDKTFYQCYGIIKYDFSTYTTIPSLANTNTFTGIASDAKIVVPDALYDEWIAATNWTAASVKSHIIKASEYEELQYVTPTIITYTDGSTAEVEAGDDGILTWQMTKGGSSYTASNTTIQSVKIGSDVAAIWNYAFYGCSSLTSVKIPESVTKIGFSAFYFCKSLTSVTISSSVTSIEGLVFTNCFSLNDITFNKSMEEVLNISNCPWGIPSGKVIKCTDGDIPIP